jgi:hypothetical protein
MTSMAPEGAHSAGSQAPSTGDFSVNETLPPATQIEASEFARAVRRMVAALGRRAEHGDLEALREVDLLRRHVFNVSRQAAGRLHEDHGYSWYEIGRACGISRQAAEQRWGRE